MKRSQLRGDRFDFSRARRSDADEQRNGVGLREERGVRVVIFEPYYQIHCTHLLLPSAAAAAAVVVVVVVTAEFGRLADQ